MGIWTSRQASPSPSTSSDTSTSTSSSRNSGPSLRLSRARYRRPSVVSAASSSQMQPASPIQTAENPTNSTCKDEPTPLQNQFAHSMNLGHQVESYSKRYRTRLPSGYWLSNEIPLHLVVENIPIVGYINEYDQPIPSLDGPDIHLTLATLDQITRIGEENDWNAMSELPQVFHLSGPRKGQLIDAYAWIALRGNDGDKFVMSRRARSRLVRNWKDLVKDYDKFGECLPDPCDMLLKAARGASAEAHYCIAMFGEQTYLAFVDEEVEEIMEKHNMSRHEAEALIKSVEDLESAALGLEIMSEEIASMIDKMDV